MSKYIKTIIVQQDYVRRAKPVFLRHKKSTSSPPFASKAIFSAILLAFISALYFFIVHKKEEFKTHHVNKVSRNTLPQKPEERWRYIKELENRRPENGRRSPEFFTASQVKSSKQLKTEQKELLNEIRWNKENLTQHQQGLQVQIELQKEKGQEQWTKIQPGLKQSHPYQNLSKMPKYTISQRSTTMTKKNNTHEKIIDKNKQYWIVQCGSFKGVEQAKIMRAKLALKGFDSRVTSNNGWNRVVIGPVKSKKNADDTITHLKTAGQENCVRRSFEN